MGDIVYTTPMFCAVKTVYPDSRLYVIGGGRAKEVIGRNPYVDEYIDYKDNFWEVVKKLRKENIDFACLANLGSTIGFAMLYLGGVKCISVLSLASGDGDKSFSYSILRELAVIKPFYTGTYVPSQYLKLLEPIKANTGDIHFRLYFSKEAESRINIIFTQNNIKSDSDFIVAFAPGGAVEERWWPAERFARLAEFLYRERNAKILIIGAGKDERAISAMVNVMNKNVPYVNFLNQNLDEFKAAISKCNLVIGNDSGPMVTADAFDVANLVFVGPTDEREYHLPPGPKNRVLKGAGDNVSAITFDMAKKEIYLILSTLSKKKETCDESKTGKTAS